MKYIGLFRNTSDLYDKGMVLEDESFESARKRFILSYGESLAGVYPEVDFNHEIEVVPFGTKVVFKKINHETNELIREMVYPLESSV